MIQTNNKSDNNMDINQSDNQIKLFTCPISLKIFKEPLLASDGYFYEKHMITKWFVNSSKSPIKGTNLVNKNLLVSPIFNSLLENFLITHPENKLDQFSLMIPIEYKSIYTDENYKKFCDDNKIYAELITEEFLKSKEMMNSDFIFKLIDSIDDIYYFIKSTDRIILNQILTKSKFEIVKYLLDKPFDFEFEENDDLKWKPICYICFFSCEKSVKYAIDKGLDLNSLNNYEYYHIGKKNLNVVLEYFFEKNIQFDFTKNLNDDYETNLLFGILENCSKNIISKVIDILIQTCNLCQLEVVENNQNMLHYFIENPCVDFDFFVEIMNKIDFNGLTVDINLKDDINHLRPFQIAINSNKPEIAKFIISHHQFDKSSLIPMITQENFDLKVFTSFLVNNFI
jgi:hypothetical protein